LRADTARATYGVDGSGVRVGVLSDSFDKSPPDAATNAAEDVAAGELPGAGNPCGRTTPVDNRVDTLAGGEDEGRALAQTVHDLATGAALGFATALASDTAFANNIVDLANSGAHVIV